MESIGWKCQMVVTSRGKVKLGEAGLTKDFKNMHLMYIM